MKMRQSERRNLQSNSNEDHYFYFSEFVCFLGKSVRWLMILILIVVAPPIRAQSRGDEIYGQVGPWLIAESNDGCFATASFVGGTDLTFTYRAYDSTSMLIISNELFASVESGTIYPIEILFHTRGRTDDGWGSKDFLGVSGRAVGITLDAEVLDDIAAADGISFLYRGRRVEKLSLKGSSKAVFLLVKCGGNFARKHPRDPFADPDVPPRTSVGASPASPRGMVGSWVTNDDYPPGARRAGQQGVTSFRIDIDVSGSPVACTITQSSGHSVLDNATCSLLMRRARFNPAKNAQGKPVPGAFESRFRWSLESADGNIGSAQP
ncbi:energy transducer TonB [Sphingomonas canadensis]|uniref:Energy transducer TonB n=1 Tax=Sphingomonas canadensis TaxID=1219257 RepID=A0ABW3H975_9SPHN|nr:energy transducer TonB [Sphingomonas canadensis]MCW3835911.1 energy transducer TonB [Sphingomonas canadensis]